MKTSDIDTTCSQPQGVVLIIDDSVENIRYLVSSLIPHGFKAIYACNGEKGIQQAKLEQPDLILLDVMMPGISGFEACSRLKADVATRDIPVIFISALSNMVDKIKGFEVGGVDWIAQPFHPEELLARVKVHLALRRQYRELHQQYAALQEFHASKQDRFDCKVDE